MATVPGGGGGNTPPPLKAGQHIPAPPAGSNRAAQISWYGYYVDQVPGTYQGSATAYRGQTWIQIYNEILQAYPTVSPGAVAGAVLVEAAGQGLAPAVAGGATGLGQFTATAAGASVSGLDQIGKDIPAPLSGIDAIGAFFNQLGEASTWIRVGEVLLGIVLLGIGVAHLTHADNFIAKAAGSRIP